MVGREKHGLLEDATRVVAQEGFTVRVEPYFGPELALMLHSADADEVVTHH